MSIGELPDSWYQVLLAPVVLALIGCGIWFFGRHAELKEHAGPWKWLGAVPLLFALVFGWAPFSRVRDVFYNAAIEPFGKRMQMAHYAAFLVPLLVAAAVAGFEFYDRRRSAEDR